MQLRKVLICWVYGAFRFLLSLTPEQYEQLHLTGSPMSFTSLNLGDLMGSPMGSPGLFFRWNLVELHFHHLWLRLSASCSPRLLVITEVWLLCLQVKVYLPMAPTVCNMGARDMQVPRVQCRGRHPHWMILPL